MKMIKWIAVLLLIVLAGCRQGANNPLTEDIFKITVQNQTNAAKKKMDAMQINTVFTPKVDPTPLLLPQPDSGNAAELYWAVLKDRTNPNEEKTRKFLEQMGPIMQVFDLAAQQGDKVSFAPPMVDVVKTEAQQAAALPELEQFEKGARRKNFLLTGESIPVPEYIVSLPNVPAAVLNGYAGALMCKALLKEQSGDKAAAETLMQTILAVGHHFSQDANYPHYFGGLSLVKFASVGLKNFYKRNGKADREQEADKLDKLIDEQSARLTQLQARDETNQPFNMLNALGYLDTGVDSLANVASNNEVPPAFRAKAIECILSGYLLRYFMADRSGRPPETTEYAAPSDQRLQALQKLTQLPDKTLAQMARNSEQMLTKMKTQSGGERMKYLREAAKVKD